MATSQEIRRRIERLKMDLKDAREDLEAALAAERKANGNDDDDNDDDDDDDGSNDE